MSADAPRTARRLRSGVSFGGRSFQVISEWVNGAASVDVDVESAAPPSPSSFGAALQGVDRARGGGPVACQVLTNRGRRPCCWFNGEDVSVTEMSPPPPPAHVPGLTFRHVVREGNVLGGDVNADDAVSSAQSTRYVASNVVDAIISYNWADNSG